MADVSPVLSPPDRDGQVALGLMMEPEAAPDGGDIPLIHALDHESNEEQLRRCKIELMSTSLAFRKSIQNISSFDTKGWKHREYLSGPPGADRSSRERAVSSMMASLEGRGPGWLDESMKSEGGPKTRTWTRIINADIYTDEQYLAHFDPIADAKGGGFFVGDFTILTNDPMQTGTGRGVWDEVRMKMRPTVVADTLTSGYVSRIRPRQDNIVLTSEMDNKDPDGMLFRLYYRGPGDPAERGFSGLGPGGMANRHGPARTSDVYIAPGASLGLLLKKEREGWAIVYDETWGDMLESNGLIRADRMEHDPRFAGYWPGVIERDAVGNIGVDPRFSFDLLSEEERDAWFAGCDDKARPAATITPAHDALGGGGYKKVKKRNKRRKYTKRNKRNKRKKHTKRNKSRRRTTSKKYSKRRE
jgi:hypothetical protein